MATKNIEVTFQCEVPRDAQYREIMEWLEYKLGETDTINVQKDFQREEIEATEVLFSYI